MRDTPPCYDLGCPSCIPTRRWREQGRLYIGSNYLQHSSRQLQVWVWADLQRVRGRLDRQMDNWRLRPPGRPLIPEKKSYQRIFFFSDQASLHVFAAGEGVRDLAVKHLIYGDSTGRVWNI